MFGFFNHWSFALLALCAALVSGGCSAFLAFYLDEMTAEHAVLLFCACTAVASFIQAGFAFQAIRRHIYSLGSAAGPAWKLGVSGALLLSYVRIGVVPALLFVVGLTFMTGLKAHSLGVAIFCLFGCCMAVCAWCLFESGLFRAVAHRQLRKAAPYLS